MVTKWLLEISVDGRPAWFKATNENGPWCFVFNAAEARGFDTRDAALVFRSHLADSETLLLTEHGFG